MVKRNGNFNSHTRSGSRKFKRNYENGNFEFTNYTPKIGFYRIKTNDKNFAMLVLDSADKVTITGSVKDLGNTFKVEGSSETTIFIEYNNLSKSLISI